MARGVFIMMTNEKNINKTEETFNALKKCIKDVNREEILNLRIPGHSVFTINVPYVIVGSTFDYNTEREYVVAVRKEIVKIVNEWKQNMVDYTPTRYPTYYSESAQREAGIGGIGISRFNWNGEKYFGRSNGRFAFTIGSIQYEFDFNLLGERLREFEEFLESEGYKSGLRPHTDCGWTYFPVEWVDSNSASWIFNGIKRPY